MRRKLAKKGTANDKQVPSTSQSKRSKADEAMPTKILKFKLNMSDYSSSNRMSGCGGDSLPSVTTDAYSALLAGQADNYLVCGNVHNIAIYNASNRRLHNDTIAEIDCDEGYYNINDAQTSGISTATIRCSGNGTWVNMPTCVRKDCGKLDQLNISNAKLRLFVTDTKYQSNAVIACDTGYTDQHKHQAVDTSTTLIKCSANGTWTNVPKCVRKDCGNIYNLNIDNAAHRRQYNGTKYTSTAEIDCDEGYYNTKVTQTTGISTTTIRCSEHGIWVNIPTCVRKECGDLSLLNISNAENRDPINGTKYNSIANISCDAGYNNQNESQSEGIASIFIRCNENGTWVNQPRCVRKDCGDLNSISIDNAVNRRQHNDTKYNSTADIDCDEGYYNKKQNQTAGISTTTISCSEHGIWVNKPTCIRKNCGDVHNINIDNAANRLPNNDTKYGSTADIDCDEGYYNINYIQTAEISTTTIHCSENGTWKNIPSCIRKDCGSLSTPRNGNIAFEHNDTFYGSNATVTCHDGYSVAGPDNIVCEKTGNWSSYITHCQINECKLPEAGNTFTQFVNASTETTYHYGDLLLYQCDIGYEFAKDASQNLTKAVRCTDRGFFEHLETCTRKAILNTKKPEICFNCDDMSSPEYCDIVARCQKNQVCYTESYPSVHGKVFRSGCMDEHKCHREENSTSSAVCVECCSTDMCNNKGCGNSDFPTREHRGPMCFDCHHTGDINSCSKVTMCSSDQVCSIGRYQWGDSFHYKLGCTHHLCNPVFRHILRSVPSCHSCCNDDYCNRNCSVSNSVPGEIFVG
ncbi:sushi, von Willebrand factor type A, EGF and pentraxin domain-containing protein 1-like [Mercenaria mercenaria]|uniref:sushi, von Willebrand factor type A, EGF and pentraxin domain-containing protein 1-like n=1 Tax=Mercenaria mercenaria TaxID=6596 RepID=UPI00234F3393|nr:sushi, von Willebrand factor type A, EGF and pentraxin domain-containing protein 1-like [Mercenaria mercenaria]